MEETIIFSAGYLGEGRVGRQIGRGPMIGSGEPIGDANYGRVGILFFNIELRILNRGDAANHADHENDEKLAGRVKCATIQEKLYSSRAVKRSRLNREWALYRW